MNTVNRGKIIIISIITTITLLLLFLIGPLDLFKHGFFCDEITYEDIPEDDRIDKFSLSKDYKLNFSPADRHFAGFKIMLMDNPEGNSGKLTLTIYDRNGAEQESQDIDLSDITEETWYMIYTSASYKQGETYSLNFHVSGCDNTPSLQLIDSDYMSEESMGDELLICYAYAESTFSFQEKILFTMAAVAILVFIYGEMFGGKHRGAIRIAALFVALVTIFTWNYMYNTFDYGVKGDNSNQFMNNFQADSETLVTGVIEADRNGASKTFKYGLGRWYDELGKYNNYTTDFVNDDNWDFGYHRSKPMICVSNNDFTRKAVVIGGEILFANGDRLKIKNIETSDDYINITLDTDSALSRMKYGDLGDIEFYGGELTGKGIITEYKSQYGLQGKVFRFFAGHMGEDYRANLNLICSLATAMVLVSISLLIGKKYNKLMGGCFAITFLIGPWIMFFARNLYWVEFTWFLPMLVGLICSIFIHKKWVRIAGYFAAFICIMGKCLCGYEYISTIMLGLIAFLLVDLIINCIKKDKAGIWLVLRTTILIGIMALLGFMAAICIHASFRGDGNLMDGIKAIIDKDVLRRTIGANMNEYGEDLWPSFNASIWEVVQQYIHFTTDLLPGIKASLFPALCMIPLCIFISDYCKGKLSVQSLALYIVFLAAALSWFVLAKAHSYVHVHMNYVLWYFGFVQICLYIIVDKISSLMRRGVRE